MKQKKAAVFILLGQSNAVGHGIPMQEEDKVLTPLKNVFGLHRNENLCLNPEKLVWSGYTSGGMNLGEEQDHTYSLANCVATRWQQQIDAGKDLPDLYIVQIAIGAQGVTQKYMWFPFRKEKMLPGKLETVDISLFPFTMKIFSLLNESFRAMGKEFEIMGMHWRGGENDAVEDPQMVQNTLLGLYRYLFGEFRRVLGEFPLTLHEIHCPNRMDFLDATGKAKETMYRINKVFEALTQSLPQTSLFDVRNAPFYAPETKGNGIFIQDEIHYNPQTNQWVAECIVKDYVKSRGIL